MPRIFISYRRADSQDISNRIHEHLATHFGTENIFIDSEDILGGEDFEEKIFQEISNSDVMLVIIGKLWTSLKRDETSSITRLFEDGDVVRAEVETGLRLPSVTVIPVLVGGANMPAEAELPKSIRKIIKLNARSVRNEPDFNGDMQKLVPHIEKNLSVQKTESPPKVEPVPKILNWYQGLSFVRKSLLWLFSAIVATLTFAFAALPLLTNDQLDDLRLKIGLITAVPTSTAPTLEIDERSDLISQNALRISLQDVASNPHDLVLAPSSQGLAMWGYSGAGGDLFALDIASGTPLVIGQSESNNRRFRVSDFDDALTSALYYDGEWLWVGDSRNHRLLAFAPTTLELKQEVLFGDNGQPVSITQTGTVLWVALQDTGEIAAIAINHDAGSYESYCVSQRLAVGESPFALVPQGQASLWVAYGRGDESAVRAISVQDCSVFDAIPFDNPIDSITIHNNHLWGTANGSVWQIKDNVVGMIDVPDVAQIETITSSEDLLWLSTGDGELISFSPDEESTSIVLSLTSPPTDIRVFGVQVWVLTEGNTAIRFTIPYTIYPNLVALVWQSGNLWAIGQNGQICALQGDPACFQLELDSTPITMAASQRENLIWLSTDDGSVWSVDVRTQTAEKSFNLSQPALQIIEQDGDYLWVTDTVSLLSIIDLNTDNISNILASNFNIRPPTDMAFDGSTLWFAYDFPSEIGYVTYVDKTARLSPLAITGIGTLTAITADSSNIYISEPGRLFIINPQQQEVIQQLGLDHITSGLIVGNEALWAYNTQTGFIFQLGL